MNTNILAGISNLLYGKKWINFIAQSRAILGSNSGSSVNLKNKKIYSSIVKNYIKKNKIKINQKIIPAEDRNKSYTCLSPKNLEAAFLGVVQILVKGDYGNILKEYRDYIPLDENCKNINEVLKLFHNEKLVNKMIKSSKKSLLSKRELHSDYVINSVLNRINKKVYISEKTFWHKYFIFVKLYLNFIVFYYYKIYVFKDNCRRIVNNFLSANQKIS